MILGNSKQLGLNRISTKEVLLGAMGDDELKAMLDGKSLFDFRAEQSFHIIDTNKSNTLSKQEVKDYVKESIDGELDEEHLIEDLKKWNEFDLNDDGEFSIEEFKLIYKQMILQ
jgi:Ca2+-binding EF-hand superfamily protein